jgi:hypothetical protein
MPSNLQIADIFTKNPWKSLFMLFRSKLRVLPSTLDLKGSIGDNTDSFPAYNQGENRSKH